jgi:hypothetical protein
VVEGNSAYRTALDSGVPEEQAEETPPIEEAIQPAETPKPAVQPPVDKIAKKAPKVTPPAEVTPKPPSAKGKRAIAVTDKELHELMRESLGKNEYTMYLQDEVQARTQGDAEAASRAFDQEASVMSAVEQWAVN